jgi:hypothetical protein
MECQPDKKSDINAQIHHPFEIALLADEDHFIHSIWAQTMLRHLRQFIILIHINKLTTIFDKNWLRFVAIDNPFQTKVAIESSLATHAINNITRHRTFNVVKIAKIQFVLQIHQTGYDITRID